MEIDHKGVNQLLLSPLYLFDQILSTVIPGALFMLLLGLKGNAMLRAFWYESPLGYKTKIAAFVVLAYVVGNLVKLPLNLIASIFSFRKKEDIAGLSEGWKKQTPEVRAALTGIIFHGSLLATPGLVDFLSVNKAEAGFHLGAGAALVLAAFVPGDGSLRWLEALMGLAMLFVAVSKAKQHAGLVLQTVGVGIANVFARMSPQQLQMTAAIIKGLNIADTPDVAPPEVVTPPAEAPLPKADAPAENTV